MQKLRMARSLLNLVIDTETAELECVQGIRFPHLKYCPANYDYIFLRLSGAQNTALPPTGIDVLQFV